MRRNYAKPIRRQIKSKLLRNLCQTARLGPAKQAVELKNAYFCPFRQKKAEAASIVSKFGKTDAKERSKERKKTVEAKVDKKTQAMDLLKAKREAKKERAEEKEKQRIEEMSRRDDDYDLATEKDDLDTKSTITERSGPRRKLKTEDIYSDDSASDWENSSTVNAKTRRESSSDDSDSEAGERYAYQDEQNTQSLNSLLNVSMIRSLLFFV